MKTDLGRNFRFFYIGSLLLLLLGFAGITQFADAADTYEIDTAHSMIIFRAKHNKVVTTTGGLMHSVARLRWMKPMSLKARWNSK